MCKTSQTHFVSHFPHPSAYTAREGFGLGLPLSKKLAERLGGGLSIDSKPGHGTTVYVWLPFVAVGAKADAPQQLVGFD